jgi:protoporphyrin/coproporphyrin ferrochelatase
MKRAIVLMNLGSPDSTSVKDVKRYLDEFLMDEKVIDKPWLFRFLLVKGIIVPFRAPKSAKAYRSIWTEEGSPLIVISKQLRDALKKEVPETVAIAMRYGNPSPRAAFDELVAKNPDLEEVIAVPLYPHYAMSSFETAVDYAKEQHKEGGYSFKLTTIKPYYDNELYIEALTESIRPFLNSDWDHILFSYHGVPERHIYKGDTTGQHCLKVKNCCEVPSPAHQCCYRHHCVVTTNLVAEKLGIPAEKMSLTFQSRLGRDPWLQPYTAATLEKLPERGIKKLLVVCPAFVSDCLETLEEIAEEGKELFIHAGGEQFEMIPCLNVNPLWVKAIAQWVKQYGEGDQSMIFENGCSVKAD